MNKYGLFKTSILSLSLFAMASCNKEEYTAENDLRRAHASFRHPDKDSDTIRHLRVVFKNKQEGDVTEYNFDIDCASLNSLKTVIDQYVGTNAPPYPTKLEL